MLCLEFNSEFYLHNKDESGKESRRWQLRGLLHRYNYISFTNGVYGLLETNSGSFPLEPTEMQILTLAN